jgi:hypothetical protein
MIRPTRRAASNQPQQEYGVPQLRDTLTRAYARIFDYLGRSDRPQFHRKGSESIVSRVLARGGG